MAAETKQVGHTPTPWGFSEYLPGYLGEPPDFPSVGPEGSDEAVCWIEMDQHTEAVWQANAAFIVKACNNHDALLEGCLEAESLITALEEHPNPDEDSHEQRVLKIIRAAIAAAT